MTETCNNNNQGAYANLKIKTLNVRGLRKKKKRRALFHAFKKNKFDIICLQETYLMKEDYNIIDREWGGKFHLVEGTNRSKGLLTLFSKQLQNTCLSLVKVNERFIISQLASNELNLTIFNVVPCSNAEKSVFLNNIFKTVSDTVSSFNSSLILLGDFNTVLDNSLDIVSGDYHADSIVNTPPCKSNATQL